MRAQHAVNVEGTGCEVIADPYSEGYLRWMLEDAEAHPFPAYRRFPKVTEPT